MKKTIYILLLPGLFIFCNLRLVGQYVTKSGFFTVTMDKGKSVVVSQEPGDTVAGRNFFNLMNKAFSLPEQILRLWFCAGRREYDRGVPG